MKKLRIFRPRKRSIVGVICLSSALVLAWFIWSDASLQKLKKASSNEKIFEAEPLPDPREISATNKSEYFHAPSSGPETASTPEKFPQKSLLREDLDQQNSALSVVLRNKTSRPDPLASFDIDLEPRKPHPPVSLHLPDGKKLMLTVKFMDWVMARSSGDNQVDVSGVEGEDINQLVTLARKHDLVFNPTFDKPKQLDSLRTKAALRSGQMQADLNGTMTIVLPDPSQALEIARSIQSIGMIESVDIESLDLPPPPPADIPPTTPSLEGQQGYLNSNPGFGVNNLKALGVNGGGIRFSDCEYGYNPDHEDLVDSNITDDSRAAINPTVYTNGWDDHGTAAIGITMAGDNGYGITGMAPQCDAYFYSEWTTLGYSRNNSVIDAVINSTAGDVILLEMQDVSGVGSNAYVPAEYSSTIWNLTKTATDAGIIVVAAAGNGNQNLDDSYYESYMNRGNSGAIIVGAGSSNTTHSKKSFSTYGTRVDVQAWGGGVMTTGYGSYALYGGDENQGYISGFSGTSSASACVAGAVVLLQSYAKNKLNTLFTPNEIRAHLKTYAHPQGGSGGNIGSAIALDLAVAELPDRPTQVTLAGPNGDDVSLSISGLPFRTYKIEASQNLLQWNDLITDITGSKNKIDKLLIDELNSYPKRFYRLSEE